MIYLFLANGFEEIEALTPVDILRRGGLGVTTVGIGGKEIKGSHNITVTADISDSEFHLLNDVEGIILPGGMPGTRNLEKCNKVIKAVNYCFERNLLIGAICAAPSILGHKGLLKGKTAVCYEGFETQLDGANIGIGGVAEDGIFITARGAGVAVNFGLKLVEKCHSKAESQRQRNAILCD